MNGYIYSPSEDAFYAVALKKTYELRGAWPVDALDISDEISAKYMAEPPMAKVRVAGADGYPVWADKPEPTHDELIVTAEAKKQERIGQANDYINSKQWPGKAVMGRLNDTERMRYNDWLDYLDVLDAIDTSIAQEIIWPESPEV